MRKKRVIPPADSAEHQNQTAFRILERKIKRKGPFDTSLLTSLDIAEKRSLTLFGSTVEAFEFADMFPGMFLVKRAIPPSMQLSIVHESLEDWAKSPNISNLDSHFHIDPSGIWNQYAEWKKDELNGREEPMIRKRKFNTQAPSAPPANKPDNMKSCELKKAGVISVYDPDTNLVIDPPVDSMLKDDDQPVSKVINRLRWLTLGYQYNWSKKEYHFDRVPPFPTSLAVRTQHIVEQTAQLTGYDPALWVPEAGIVNFYQPGDTLTAHQDKSEVNKTSPLISLSIGLECIFLFGTDDRSDEPVALHLESGDLIIMSGKARQSFHGVPRVLENTCPDYLCSSATSLIAQHLNHTRVNLNIRQVF